MITSIEIKKKALRKYPEYLRNVAAGTDFQPIVILLSMLKSKCFDHYFHFKLRFYILGYKAGGFWPWQ